ncbi:uncharacterized protein LOC131265471 [Anopheles coustani]|uniref:uncharacterized protein LOC131265471 n=1 Tax=Anopheles coustani TaxID=139045 RepID=UPI002657ABA0|nr:uncharacterized protein LOC131265471 [Anopheles coustani]
MINRGYILCTSGEFVPYSDSNTLLRATPAGLSEQGEPLHFGRVKHYGKFYYGKVQRSHDRVCYVSISGKERAFTKYDIFIRSAVNPEVTNPATIFDPLSTAAWVEYFVDNEPPNIVIAYSSYAETLLIGRAKHRGGVIPGVVNSTKKICTIVWGGRVLLKRKFEVLTNVKGMFVPIENNEIPANAVPTGRSETGETLYTGRVVVRGWPLVGKVRSSDRLCYVPYGSEERSFSSYKIFVSHSLTEFQYG